MKRLLVVISGCLLLSPAIADTGQFAQRFSLDLDGNAAYYTVALPASVYAASRRSDLGDIRVFNAAGEPVPYSIEAPAAVAHTAAKLQPVHWFPLPPGVDAQQPPLSVTIAPDGSLRAVGRTSTGTSTRAQHDTDLVDIGNVTGRVDALLVHLRNENYQGRVTIEASDDLRAWQAAGDAQLLKASYAGNTLAQERIALEDLHARYVRLRWLDRAPDIAAIEVEAQADDTAPTTGAARQWREGLQARAGRVPGEYLFDTGGAYPLDRLRLSLPQPNTVAHATIYSRTEAQAPWREVIDTTLFRLRSGTAEQSSPPLEIVPDGDREWRVAVDMRNGGLGSGELTITTGWRPAVLTFVARGAAPFTLAVGNGALESAALGRDDLLVGTSSVAASARIGAALPMAAQDRDALSATRDSEATRRYVLWAALLLAVGALAAMAWHLARNSKNGGGAGTD
jgi:hypothetical protein